MKEYTAEVLQDDVPHKLFAPCRQIAIMLAFAMDGRWFQRITEPVLPGV